jgi:hypothetical protein
MLAMAILSTRKGARKEMEKGIAAQRKGIATEEGGRFDNNELEVLA